VLTKDHIQLLIYDTPGVLSTEQQRQRYRARLTSELMTAAWAALDRAGIVILMIDATKLLDDDTRFIMSHWQRTKEYQRQQSEGNDEEAELILVINKIDKVKPDRLQLLMEALTNESLIYMFKQVFSVSAATGENVDSLKEYLLSKSKPGKWEYSSTTRTDQPNVTKVTEIIREKILRRLNKEIPYQVEQQTTGWTVLEHGELQINQVLIVANHRQKSILIGKAGKAIRHIATAAAEEIKMVLNRPVKLKIDVITKSERKTDSAPPIEEAL